MTSSSTDVDFAQLADVLLKLSEGIRANALEQIRKIFYHEVVEDNQIAIGAFLGGRSIQSRRKVWRFS